MTPYFGGERVFQRLLVKLSYHKSLHIRDEGIRMEFLPGTEHVSAN